MLKRLWAKWFPKHEWVLDGEKLTRTCRVCGQCDEYDQGAGAVGAMWAESIAGDPSKHFVTSIDSTRQPSPALSAPHPLA